MDASEDFKAQQQKIQAALVAVNRTVNSITREDLTFQRTVNPEAASQLDDNAARLLSLTSRLLKASAGAMGKKGPNELEDADDVDLNWQSIVDVIDSLLEKADTTLDEYTGLLKRKDAPNGESGPEFKKPKPTNEKLDWSIRRANIVKPQNQFEHKPNNFDKGPWKPLLTYKPNAIVPLADSLSTFVTEDETTQYKHPYEMEITEMHYPDAIYKMTEPTLYLPTETTAAVWVDTFEGVEAVLEELREADEIAVDLEHHDYRTYAGLLSLMQISTRKKDWVIDTLKPWRHRLEILNEVFTDPTKVKVFHGATSDIVWLQRDLGLYIVGLFDTYFACDCLEYPARSLAYLLKRFVDFDADKKYQMADWRIRPLPEEMLYYARSDTHFLLYVYDMLRNELADKSGDSDKYDLEKNLTSYVLQKSKETSLQRYENATCDSETGQGTRGWFNNLVKSYANLSGQQFAVYKALFEWRDEISRAEDESPGYIMPMRALADIARILPTDHKALWSLLHNCARTTKDRIDEIFGLIQDAQSRGAAGPTSAEFLRSTSFEKTAFRKTYGTGAARVAVKASDSHKDQAKLPDISELRSDFSQLWGSISMAGKKMKDKNTSTAAHLEAPWFSFVQAAVAGVTDATATPKKPTTEEYIDVSFSRQKPQETKEAPDLTSVPIATATAVPPPASKTTGPEEGEAFTIIRGKSMKVNNQGKDKKGKEQQTKKVITGKTSGEEAKEDDEDSEDDDDGGGAPLNTGDADINMGDGDFVPFNYDTARSVLHTKTVEKHPERADKKGGKHKKAFNPYNSSTTAEGPKGARKLHYEKVGKSATFKK